MRYTELGSTKEKVSVLTLGTWAIGGAGWGNVLEKDCLRAIDCMIDQGVNSIDTAPAYGCGSAEQLLGRAVKGKRNKIFLTTKGGVTWDSQGELIIHPTYNQIISDCEASLKRLDTDYVDLYLIHWPSEDVAVEENIRALETLKRDGKIRFTGASNFSQGQIIEARKNGSFDVLQQPYSMVAQEYKELLVWAHSNQIGTMSYGSLGAGILTGSIREMPQFEENDMRLTFYDYYKEPKFSKVMELVKYLDIFAEKYSKPVAQVTINWSTQCGFLDTILMGVRNEHEALENCASLDWQLDAADVDSISRKIVELLG